MYNGNSRFNMLSNGVPTEQISCQTQLFYNPVTQHARAIFNGSAFMALPDANGGPTQYVAVGTENDILHVDFMDKLTDIPCVAGDYDPITGAPLDQISVYGVMVLMKRAYDKYHNEREQQRLAEIAAAEAAAAAAAAEAAAAAAAEAAAAEGGETPPPEEPTP
jgi:hypothetical protein